MAVRRISIETIYPDEIKVELDYTDGSSIYFHLDSLAARKFGKDLIKTCEEMEAENE